jgi:hypothetical protein
MLYGRTNKQDAMKQAAKQYQRRTVLKNTKDSADVMEREELTRSPPEVHHSISQSRNKPLNIFSFVTPPKDKPADPAKKVCDCVTLPKLFL